MGVYLNKPVTTKESEEGGNIPNTFTRYGLSSMQGWRIYMEDAHLANTNLVVDPLNRTISIFGVFDGHGGPAVSNWVAQEFERIFLKEVQKTLDDFDKEIITSKSPEFPKYVSVLCESLQRSFLRIDEEISLDHNRERLKQIHESAEEKRKDLEALHEGESAKSFIELMVANMPDQINDPYIDAKNSAKDEMKEDSPQLDLSSGNSSCTSNTYLGSEDVNANSKESESTNPIKLPYSASNLSSLTDNVSKIISTTVGVNKDYLQPEPRAAKVRVIEDGQVEPKALTQNQPADSNTTKEQAIPLASEDEFSLNSTDYNIQPYQPESCGTTAIVTVIVEGSYPCLIVANAGDSRAVLCRDGVAIPLSFDHKPMLKGENRRIINAGGKVFNGRVDGNLNLSRSLGDLYYKSDKAISPELQKITSFPDVRVLPLNPKDEFLILACDGIWDCLSNQKIVEIVQTYLRQAGRPDSASLIKICENICDDCLAKDPLSSDGGIGCDNMTIMIVLLGQDIIKNATPTIRATDNLLFYGIPPYEDDFEEIEHDQTEPNVEENVEAFSSMCQDVVIT